jgi:hypothetical protein
MAVVSMARPTDSLSERSAILTGQCRGRIWYGRLREHRIGGPSSVDFDWKWVLKREEQYGDILGFYHTHPGGFARPSERDTRTMRAWVSCLGKPLMCVIESFEDLIAYIYETDEDDGSPFAEMQRFPRNVLIAVKDDQHAR